VNHQQGKDLGTFTVNMNLNVTMLDSSSPIIRDLLARIEKKLDGISAQETKLMAAIDDLESKVAEEGVVQDGAIVLLENLSTMIKAAGTDPVRLNALTTLIDTNKTKLAAAIAANTPGAQPQP